MPCDSIPISVPGAAGMPPLFIVLNGDFPEGWHLDALGRSEAMANPLLLLMPLLIAAIAAAAWSLLQLFGRTRRKGRGRAEGSGRAPSPEFDGVSRKHVLIVPDEEEQAREV